MPDRVWGMDVKRAYRFRFYPTPEQEVMLARTFGCARFAYNHMLRLRAEAREDGCAACDPLVAHPPQGREGDDRHRVERYGRPIPRFDALRGRGGHQTWTGRRGRHRFGADAFRHPLDRRKDRRAEGIPQERSPARQATTAACQEAKGFRQSQEGEAQSRTDAAGERAL